MKEEEEEDWETIDIPDLKNIERELKKLKERELIEEDNVELIKDLFNPIIGKKIVLIKDEIEMNTNTIETNTIETKTNEIKNFKSKSNKTQSNKARKDIMKRHKEIFGEAEPDEYEEKYGYIADI